MLFYRKNAEFPGFENIRLTGLKVELHIARARLGTFSYQIWTHQEINTRES